MSTRSSPLRTLGASAVFAFAVMASACTPLQPRAPSEPVLPPIESPADKYLELIEQLANDDPAHQSDVFYAVEKDYTAAPTTANSLRYALALVTPNHPAVDLTKGKKLLEQTLATPEKLLPAEQMLASSMLKITDTLLQLQAENRRLLATVDEHRRAQANSDRRAQSQAEENARLRKALDEARQKLDAIRDIERSIIERSPTPPGNLEPGTREPPNETQSPPAGR